MNTAQQLFDGTRAQSRIEDRLYECGVSFDHIGWDEYDCSLEIHGVLDGDRLNPEVQKFLFDCGFLRVFVNHVNGWETHYAFGSTYADQDGWRVFYGNKHGQSGLILLEKKCEGWPQDCYESGYVKIVPA